MASNCGAAIRQGPHHEAVKSITASFPLPTTCRSSAPEVISCTMALLGLLVGRSKLADYGRACVCESERG